MKAEVKNLNKLHIYAVEILFAASIFIASQNFNTENKSTFYAVVARHVIYIYIVRGSSEAIRVAYKAFHGNTGAVSRCCQHNHKHLLVFVAAFGYLILNQASLFGEEFLYLYVGSLVIKCMDMGVEKRKVSYGTGMACSFFEGYLALMIPSDGHTYVGLHENIRMFEANESVRFPVRRDRRRFWVDNLWKESESKGEFPAPLPPPPHPAVYHYERRSPWHAVAYRSMPWHPATGACGTTFNAVR
ncbi:hypothetical protein evm_008196 [Chilo suppressalis]|nr:hypothetical protein evm_008196 [Chilo suppressalis]